MGSAVWATASLASAQGPRAVVEIAWSAPPDCPTEAALLAETRAALRDSTAPGHSVAARGAVRRTGDRWHVDLAVKSDQGAGERSFDADSCTELTSAVALIVALAVDPTAAPPPPAIAVIPASAAAEVPKPSPPAAPAPSVAAVDMPRLAVGAAGSLDVGSLPSPGAGAAVSLAVLYRRLRVEARGHVFGGQRIIDPASPAQGVDVSLAALGGRGCFAVLATDSVGDRGLAVSPCLGLQGMRSGGAGFSAQATSLSNAAAWLDATPGLLGTWNLARSFAVRLDLEGLVPLSRPRFVVVAPEGQVAGVLHRPASLGGRVDLGAELRFW